MKRPCILIVTACLLGELLGYYFSIFRIVVAVIIVTASMVCFRLRFQKNILSKLNKIYFLTFFIIFCIFVFRIKYEIHFEKTFISHNVNNEKNNTFICGKVKNISFKKDNIIIISRGMIYYLKEEKYNNDIAIGNKVAFYGKVEEISAAGNPGEFDAKNYYKTKGIYCKMTVEDYDILDKRKDIK